jgi:hypothetical protein
MPRAGSYVKASARAARAGQVAERVGVHQDAEVHHGSRGFS